MVSQHCLETGVFLHEMKCNGMTSFMEFMLYFYTVYIKSVVMGFCEILCDIILHNFSALLMSLCSSKICEDIEFCKKMVSFVMAYSFTEPEKPDENDDEDEEDGEIEQKTTPYMVPMADILNHVAKNNAHLDFGKETLKMVAIKSIKKVL